MTAFLDRWAGELTIASALLAPPLLWVMLVVVKPWCKVVFGVDVPDGMAP